MGNLTILELRGGGITCHGLEFDPGGEAILLVALTLHSQEVSL